MSAFDDWVDDLNESTPNRQSFSTGPVMVGMRTAFNAGLEAAHRQATNEINEFNDPSWNGACVAIAEAIRALKEQT